MFVIVIVLMACSAIFFVRIYYRYNQRRIRPDRDVENDSSNNGDVVANVNHNFERNENVQPHAHGVADCGNIFPIFIGFSILLSFVW